VSPPSTSHPQLPPSTPHRASTIAPIKPVLSPIGTAPRSPTYQAPLTSPVTLPSPTTAEDLLNNVMGVSRISGSAGDLYRSQHHAESSAPPPPLLFGSRPGNSLGYSIWSPSKDDQSLSLSGVGNAYHSPQHHLAAPLQQDPKWYHNSSQSSQSHLPVSSQVSPFSSPSHAFASRHHQRTISSPAAAQVLAGPGQVPADPLGYISMTQTPHGYASSNINASHGTGLHYGPGVPRDYHRNHLHLDSNHTVGMGETLAPPPLSPMWGGNNG
jgi:protein SMG7